MLNGIQFKNYKPFESGEIEIKPITILLGANSVGKSSIIQLFLLLQETALANNYKSALKLHGGFYSLGEGINLFRKKNPSNTLNFKIDFTDAAIGETLTDIRDRFVDELSRFCFFVLVTVAKNEKHLKQYESLFGSDKINKKGGGLFSKALSKDLEHDPVQKRKQLAELVGQCREILKKVRDRYLMEEIFNHSFLYTRIGGSQIGNAFLNSKEEILETYDFLTKVCQINTSGRVSLYYDFSYSESILKIKKFKLLLEEVEVINVDFDKAYSDKNFITSNIYNFSSLNDEQFAYLKNSFNDKKTVFSFISDFQINEKDASVFCKYLVYTISRVISQLEESFNTQRINYVSPLRAYPKRYYFLDKAKVNSFLDTLDGEAIAEILKDNSILKNSVNNWFDKFNLQINVGAIKDIIHQILVKQNSLDLDITDVGFGVSQVLPVIIQGFLSKDKSITLVEQPEIHLHPKMQADLADLFIDIAIDKEGGKEKVNKYLIIETHSEYLLKRLRRRISEGVISAANIGIYYIQPQEKNQGAKISKINIEDKGAFEWPTDFYMGDLSDDVTVFLKNQFK